MLFARPSFACLALAVWLVPRPAHAVEAVAAGNCPLTSDVTAALDQLLEKKLDPAAPAVVTVRDLGETWEVEVAGRGASYPDPSRNCAERVRVAAVFAALVLEPPDREAPARADTVAKAPTQPASLHKHGLELAPEFVVAPGSGTRDAANGWGGGLRWASTGDFLGVSVGVNGVVPVVVKVNQHEASLGRLSFDVSARLSWRAGRVGFGTELGPYGALLFAQGRNLQASSSSTHLDAGARLAVRLSVQSPWISPFLALQGELGARQFDLVVDPSGSVGTAPRVWLGLLLGGALGMTP
jgi:hypothetical protein